MLMRVESGVSRLQHVSMLKPLLLRPQQWCTLSTYRCYPGLYVALCTTTRGGRPTPLANRVDAKLLVPSCCSTEGSICLRPGIYRR